MPHTGKAKRPVPGQTTPGFKPAQFVNVNLTRDQLETLKATDWTIDKCDSLIHALLFDGFKLTLRYDQRNSCFAAWLVPPDGHKWAGSILSGRGSTPNKAIKQLMYIHHVVLESRWDTIQDQSALELDD